MNLASWIILAVVLVALGFAIKATFFKKSSRGGCCDTGDKSSDLHIEIPNCGHMEGGGCSGCTACSGVAARNNLQPIYKPVENPPDKPTED